MYNNNYYQNSNYYHSYNAQPSNNSGYNYNYNYSNISPDKLNYQINNRQNRVIKLYPSSNMQYSNNNYLAKSPIQIPIKKVSLINNNMNYQQRKYISKSPEPYLRLYKKNLNNNSNYNYNYNQYQNHITNLNVNIRPNNYPLNIKINNIQNVNRIIKISPYKVVNQNIYHARTPEPNLRRRNKLKQKKMKANNFIAKTFINTNDIQNKNTYDINHVNKTEILSTPKNNYININSINNRPLYSNFSNNGNIQNNNIITNYSRVNYYSANYNNHNKIRHHNPINANNKNYIVNLNTKSNENAKNKLKSYNLHFLHYELHPQSNFNSAEFIIINSIGEGSFGKIYCVQWIKNNKLYAMKKLDIQTTEELNEFKSKVKIVDDLYKKTNHIGFVKLYADKVVILYNQPICYNYYIIMELGERDWEKEIQMRLLHQKYYTEYELYQIIYQLVKTLSIMQQNNVTHRDIKPANVLIMNGIYKICDFGEATIINGNGVVIQNVRGSQLFMSPILFYAYNHNVAQVMHNTYKSDVYSFGMCILLAATLSGYTLYDIREILDIQKVSKIINNKLSSRYSINFINLLIQMLQIDENLRMDFIHLENYINSFYKF